MRTSRLLLAAFLLTTPAQVGAQQDNCRPEAIGAGPSAIPYWVEVGGVSGSAHARFDKAYVAAADSLADRPASSVRIHGEWRMDWRYPNGRSCTPPDTITEPEPADSTPPSTPSGVSIMGYAAPDMTHPREHGIRVVWAAPPSDIDSVLVEAGLSNADDRFGATLPGTATEWTQPFTFQTDTALSVRACTRFQRDGLSSDPTCDEFDWAPMMYTALEVNVNAGDPPFAPGDSVNLGLVRDDGGWADGSVTRPDSVAFETGDVRHREQSFPYEFPCDLDDGCLYAVPDADSLIVKWTVFQGAGSMGGSVAYPVQ